MLGVVFLFSQFSPIEIIVFDKKFLYPIGGIDFPSSNKKKLMLFHTDTLDLEKRKNEKLSSLLGI